MGQVGVEGDAVAWLEIVLMSVAVERDGAALDQGGLAAARLVHRRVSRAAGGRTRRGRRRVVGPDRRPNLHFRHAPYVITYDCLSDGGGSPRWWAASASSARAPAFRPCPPELASEPMLRSRPDVLVLGGGGLLGLEW